MITRSVIDLDLPALAICRGMQVLNVALGGTLVQHVPETNTLHHNAIHHVEVTNGSRLHAIVGAADHRCVVLPPSGHRPAGS